MPVQVGESNSVPTYVTGFLRKYSEIRFVKGNLTN